MTKSVPGTLGNHEQTMDSFDAMVMPLKPAPFAGLDQKELEEGPWTALIIRMNKAFWTSLLNICSGLYAFCLIILCLVFLISEVVSDKIPLHYYEVLKCLLAKHLFVLILFFFRGSSPSCTFIHILLLLRVLLLAKTKQNIRE
jgi:hypothetical protein